MHADSRMRGLLRAVAVLLTVALVGACDAWIGADDRLERAQQALAAGNYLAAMADAKTALEKDPDHAGGRVLLAEVMLKLGDAAAARVEFDRALKLGAEAAALPELHYRILAGEGRHQDILIAIAADDELDPQAKLRLQAGGEIAIGQAGKGLETIRQALQRNPQDDDAAFIEIQALWSTGQQPEAIEALDRLLERSSDQARWWLFRGRYGLSLGQPAIARDAFRQARQSDQAALSLPEQLAVVGGLVEANLSAGDVTAAEQALAELNQRAPSAFGTMLLRGRVALAHGDYDTATAEMQRSLVVQPGMPFARLLLAASLLSQGALEQADAELSQLLAEQPENGDARNLLARVYLARNDIDGARRLLAAAPPGVGSNADTKWLMGNLLLRSGQSEEAIALLAASAAAEPANVALQLDLARAYLAAGQAEQAGRLLGSVPRDQGGSERQQLTILAATRGQESVEAQRRVTALATARPDNVGIQTAAGNYYFAIGDNGSAASAFRRVAAMDPGNVEARIGLAAIAMRNADPTGAESELQQALASHSGDERVLLALADVAESRRDRAAARKWLEQAIGSNPAAVESRLRLAELGIAGADAAQADSLLEQALTVARDPPAVHHRIGRIYVRHANYDKALVHFNEAAEHGIAVAAIDAVRALIALGREDEGRSRLENEIRRNPSAPMPVAMLTSLDAAARRFDRALERIAAFERNGGAPADAAEIRADVLLSAGRHSQAADSYAQAAQIRPSELLAIKEYTARAASGAGSPELVLQRWLERNPRSVGVRYLLGERYHRLGKRAAAIAEYERVLQSGSQAFALNNLALLYQEAKDPRATATARQAYELASGNPAIADTYGWILVEQGKTAEGLRILEAASAAAPTLADIRYHYAVAQARAGHTSQASATLRALLETTPEFDSRREAQSLLASLEGG